MKKVRNKSKKSGALLQRKIAQKHQPDEARKHHLLLGIQRSAGNRAVVDLLESNRHPQTKRGYFPARFRKSNRRHATAIQPTLRRLLNQPAPPPIR